MDSSSPSLPKKPRTPRSRNVPKRARVSDADIHSFHLSLARTTSGDGDDGATSGLPSSPPAQHGQGQRAGLDTQLITSAIAALTTTVSSPLRIQHGQNQDSHSSSSFSHPSTPPTPSAAVAAPARTEEAAATPKTKARARPETKPTPKAKSTPTSTSTSAPIVQATPAPALVPRPRLSEADVHLFHLLHPASATLSQPLATSSSSSTRAAQPKRRRSEPGLPAARRRAKQDPARGGSGSRPAFSHPREVLARHTSTTVSNLDTNENGMENEGRRRIKLSEERYALLPASFDVDERSKIHPDLRRKGTKGRLVKEEGRRGSYVFWPEDGESWSSDSDSSSGSGSPLPIPIPDLDEEEEEEVEDGPLFPSSPTSSRSRSPSLSVELVQTTPKGKSTRPAGLGLSSSSYSTSDTQNPLSQPRSSQIDELLPSSPAGPVSPTVVSKAQAKPTAKKSRKSSKPKKSDKSETNDQQTVSKHTTNGLLPQVNLDMSTPVHGLTKEVNGRHRESVDGSKKKRKSQGPKWVTETPR